MKTMLSGLALFFLLLLLGAGSVFAEDSVSIAVSCTVPAIPGVNAPLLEAQTTIVNSASQISKNGQLPDQSPTLQEDTEEENLNTQNQKDIVLVKTFYVR
ncbi:MAG: hypothetical protein NTY14_01775 [Candidatus Omnitrophica bacterium]|nr:hypothetical protein [Candidatus Omnitrophota bacterium]